MLAESRKQKNAAPFNELLLLQVKCERNVKSIWVSHIVHKKSFENAGALHKHKQRQSPFRFVLRHVQATSIWPYRETPTSCAAFIGAPSPLITTAPCKSIPHAAKTAEMMKLKAFVSLNFSVHPSGPSFFVGATLL